MAEQENRSETTNPSDIRKSHIKHTWWIIAVAIYVSSYVPLSMTGRYEFGNYGGQDNRITWCPTGCLTPYYSVTGRRRLGVTPLWFVYLPLILVDQIFIHPTDWDPQPS